MATITKSNGTFSVNPNGDNQITLATENTYLDKNIVFNIEGGGEEVIVNGSAPTSTTKLKINPELEEIEVLTNDDKNELINKINSIPKIEFTTTVETGDGRDYIAVHQREGYMLINVQNGDWDAYPMKVFSISKQNVYYIIHFDQYLDNGRPYRLFFFWAKMD